MIVVTDTLSLEDDEVELTFVRASGPGGQNVNKVSSAVQLRFDARRSASLPNEVSIRLQKLAGSRLTNEGVIVLSADRFRTQERNRADAVERLVAMIAKAAVAPKARRPTKPTKASKERRLSAKKGRSGIKAMRGRPIGQD